MQPFNLLQEEEATRAIVYSCWRRQDDTQVIPISEDFHTTSFNVDDADYFAQVFHICGRSSLSNIQV